MQVGLFAASKLASGAKQHHEVEASHRLSGTSDVADSPINNRLRRAAGTGKSAACLGQVEIALLCSTVALPTNQNGTFYFPHISR